MYLEYRALKILLRIDVRDRWVQNIRWKETIKTTKPLSPFTNNQVASFEHLDYSQSHCLPLNAWLAVHRSAFNLHFNRCDPHVTGWDYCVGDLPCTFMTKENKENTYWTCQNTSWFFLMIVGEASGVYRGMARWPVADMKEELRKGPVSWPL